jgi:tetratricopeptide (TPR) repeat protein
MLHARACRLAGAADRCVAAARSALAADAANAAAVRVELDALLETFPQHADALLARAECALRLQEAQAATDDLNDALTADPAMASRALALAHALASCQPGRPLAALALARALELSGDFAGAAEALDGVLAGEGADQLPLMLARRRLALACGDAARARSLLEHAERVAPSRDSLLALLHQEALARQGEARPEPGPVDAAILAGDYVRAASLLAQEPPSERKAWVLERCGRQAEAAACLERIATTEAAARDAALHDRVLSRALMGREPALMAEAPLPLQEQRTSAPRKRAAQARQTAQGGAS